MGKPQKGYTGRMAGVPFLWGNKRSFGSVCCIPTVGRAEGVQGETAAQRLVPLASKEFGPPGPSAASGGA
jgi:hypothetical protein